MTAEPFYAGDIANFLTLAAAENWVADAWELEFLLKEFPQGCFAARGGGGEMAGCVTSLRHDRSGWIGNLIVAAEQRGNGIGQKLFTEALEALRSSGVETMWLTASKSGMPLYEKYGFTSIDTIIRWVGSAGQRRAVRSVAEQSPLVGWSPELDAHGWGDRRTQLLEATARRGRLLQNESGFIVRQPSGDMVQLGPFSAVDGRGAECLFEDSIATVARGTKIMLDTPVSNRSALRLYNRGKMRIAGSAVLMYAGKKPAYRPELIYGLATMGSCG